MSNPFLLNNSSESNSNNLFSNNQPNLLFGQNNFGMQTKPNNNFNLFGLDNSKENKNEGISQFNFKSNQNKNEIEGENVINSKKNENNTENNKIDSLFGNNPINSMKNNNDNNSFLKFHSNFGEPSLYKGSLFGNKDSNENNNDKDGKKLNFFFNDTNKNESLTKKDINYIEKNEENKNKGLFTGFNNIDNTKDNINITGKLFKNEKGNDSNMNSKKEKNENLNETNYSFNPFFVSKSDKNSQPKIEKKNLFEMTSDNNKFSGKEKNSNIYYNDYSKQDIKTINIVGIDSNNDVSNSKNFNLFNQNKIGEEDNNENEEMEIDEDIKKDSSSINSENINNLWVSDNDEIIEDEIDENKRIDYKMLEESSKNKKNNINTLNLLIIPELSEFYFNKSRTLSDKYCISDSNIEQQFSIEISGKIIEILNKLIQKEKLEEEKYNEWINIFKIFIYFDAFILHRTDPIYLMKLRDNLFYK